MCCFHNFTKFFVFVTLFQISSQMSMDDFVTLTQVEKQQLEEFKALVSPKLPHDYMQKDKYLISWLREADFNMKLAEERILSMVEWRKKNKIDEIWDEDFTHFEKDYRANIEGCDKSGRPILSLIIGEWDIRRAVLSGKSEKFARYSDRIFEKSTSALRQMAADGQNVTQAWLMFDMANINPVTHICALCLPLYLQMLHTFQAYYPGSLHKIVVVNVPQFVLPVWTSYKYLVSRTYTDVLLIYGTNKKEWKQALLKDVDPSQLSEHFGGTKPQPVDFHVLNKHDIVYRCDEDYSFLNDE